MDDQRIIAFVEVKHSVRKQYLKACARLDAVHKIWLAVRDADPGQPEGRSKQLLHELAVTLGTAEQVAKVIGGCEVTAAVKRSAARDGVQLFERAPPGEHGYVHVD